MADTKRKEKNMCMNKIVDDCNSNTTYTLVCADDNSNEKDIPSSVDETTCLVIPRNVQNNNREGKCFEDSENEVCSGDEYSHVNDEYLSITETVASKDNPYRHHHLDLSYNKSIDSYKVSEMTPYTFSDLSKNNKENDNFEEDTWDDEESSQHTNIAERSSNDSNKTTKPDKSNKRGLEGAGSGRKKQKDDDDDSEDDKKSKKGSPAKKPNKTANKKEKATKDKDDDKQKSQKGRKTAGKDRDKDSDQGSVNEDNEKDKDLGIIVYQIEVRFIIFKGLRFCGGVRVLMNCQEEQAYIQLITLMNEVFATYDISNLCFLEPKSAAGVSFCGVPHKEGKKEEDEEEEEDADENEELTEAEKKRRQKCKEKKQTRIPVVEHAELVFCTPEQMVRFKTVVDTLMCATSCDDTSKPPNCIADSMFKRENEMQDAREEEQNFLDTCFEDCVGNNSAMMFENDYDGGGGCGGGGGGGRQSGRQSHMQMQQYNDYRDSRSSKRPQPQMQNSLGGGRPSKGPARQQQQMQNDFGGGGRRPKQQSAANQPMQNDFAVGESSQVPPTNSAMKKLVDMHSFDPCPKGPAANQIACLPCDLGDPYQLNPEEGRVVFCTPACLKVCSRTGEHTIYRGKLKIVQGTGGIGFVIRIENVDGQGLYCHSLRRDLTLYQTNEVPYGFCYSTVVCTSGRTSMETFVLAFPSSYQKDQFKHAIYTCKDILGMTSVQSLVNVNRVGGQDGHGKSNGGMSYGGNGKNDHRIHFADSNQQADC